MIDLYRLLPDEQLLLRYIASHATDTGGDMAARYDVKNLPFTPRTDWDVAGYSSLAKRLDLINRYNEVVGPPSQAVSQIHAEFLKDRMGSGELIAFNAVCEGLIAAAKLRDQEKG